MSLFDKSTIVGGAIIGFAVGLLAPVIARNIEATLPMQDMLVFILPVVSVVGLYAAFMINRVVPIAFQAAKFVAVGVLNTAVDFGVTNFLIAFTAIAVGWELSAFKAVGFVVAVANSYAWNKFWTFRGAGHGGVKEISSFLLVSVGGLLVNVGTAALVIHVVPSIGGLNQVQWDNVGFAAATVFSLAWNFIGYKFLVFK